MKKILIAVWLLVGGLYASETIDVQQAVNTPVENNVSSSSLAVNGSVTPVSFSAKPATGKVWLIGNIVGYIEGSTGFSAEKFANLPALVNGLLIKVNGLELAVIKTNRDLVLMMDIIDTPTSIAKLDRSFTGKWDFKEAFGKPILIGVNGIEFIVQDDLSTLVDFHVNVQGMER